MQITNMQELPINDFLRDDMLMKVTDFTPWYANIVNFMVAGYYPQRKTRRSWSTKVDATYGMIRTSTEFVLMAC